MKIKSMRWLKRDQRGVAVYFVYAIMILIISGIVWNVGNQLLFGKSGIATYYENMTPEEQKPTAGVYKWVWNVWPIVVIIGCVIYVVLAGQIREPRTW